MQYLSERELAMTEGGETGAARTPVPTQIVSNGEYTPLPQTAQQRQVEGRIMELADTLGKQQGLTRRQFLASTAGMAAAFVAMNEVYGPVFDASLAEAAHQDKSDERATALSHQMIIDDQTHFVRDDFGKEGLLGLAAYAAKAWNPSLLEGLGISTLARYKFENYVKEIFVDSDTKVALLSSAPFDDPAWDLLSNDQIVAARTAESFEFCGNNFRHDTDCGSGQGGSSDIADVVSRSSAQCQRHVVYGTQAKSIAVL